MAKLTHEQALQILTDEHNKIKTKMLEMINAINGVLAFEENQINIKGVYNDTAARDTAIPTPTKGDAALIGSASPYQMEWYDGTTWIDFGTHSTTVDLSNYDTKAENAANLALKADKATTYTKSETDAHLATKADKTAIDSKLWFDNPNVDGNKYSSGSTKKIYGVSIPNSTEYEYRGIELSSAQFSVPLTMINERRLKSNNSTVSNNSNQKLSIDISGSISMKRGNETRNFNMWDAAPFAKMYNPDFEHGNVPFTQSKISFWTTHQETNGGTAPQIEIKANPAHGGDVWLYVDGVGKKPIKNL